MSYSHVNVTLTPGQAKKLQSKNASTAGTSITLKQTELGGGQNKLSVTQTSKAKAAGKGVTQLKI